MLIVLFLIMNNIVEENVFVVKNYTYLMENA